GDPWEAVPRDARSLIGADRQPLQWGRDERVALGADPELRWRLEPFPPGVHTRPEGASRESRTLLVLWAYDAAATEVVFPLPEPPYYTELVLRGMARMLPGFAGYLERMPRAYVDGACYATAEEKC